MSEVFQRVLGKLICWWSAVSPRLLRLLPNHSPVWDPDNQNQTGNDAVWCSWSGHWTSCFYKVEEHVLLKGYEPASSTSSNTWKDIAACTHEMEVSVLRLLLGSLAPLSSCSYRGSTNCGPSSRKKKDNSPCVAGREPQAAESAESCLSFTSLQPHGVSEQHGFKIALKHFLFSRNFLFCLRGLSLCFSLPPPFPSLSGMDLAFCISGVHVLSAWREMQLPLCHPKNPPTPQTPNSLHGWISRWFQRMK